MSGTNNVRVKKYVFMYFTPFLITPLTPLIHAL